MQGVSIVMPAFQAKGTIASAVASVLKQHHPHWELLLVSDDKIDYELVLGRANLSHKGIQFLSTGVTGSGAAIARNVGLDAARFEYVATLDADDMMHPKKLELAVAQLPNYPLVSCALQLLTHEHKPLRTIGLGGNRILNCQNYKFINFSGDCTIVYDRGVADPRFDPTLFCVNDFDFLLKLFSNIQQSFHFGQVLHAYVKQPVSITKGPGASQKIIQTKQRLLERLASGYYSFADPQSARYFEHFLVRSLAAEVAYEKALRVNPNAIFEDYIEQAICPSTDLTSAR